MGPAGPAGARGNASEYLSALCWVLTGSVGRGAHRDLGVLAQVKPAGLLLWKQADPTCVCVSFPGPQGPEGDKEKLEAGEGLKGHRSFTQSAGSADCECCCLCLAPRASAPQGPLELQAAVTWDDPKKCPGLDLFSRVGTGTAMGLGLGADVSLGPVCAHL